MVKAFEKITNEIYRLKVPFENLYTSVFLIKTPQGNALVDCATYDSDVDEYIIPALNELGWCLGDIKYLILTHKHGDHAGGVKRVLELAPSIEIVQKERSILLNGIIIYALKGHTLDCIGVFDEKSGTLISGDGLQGAGVGKYRCSLENQEEYLQTIKTIQADKRIKNILFSHSYEPWYKDCACGREEVECCLEDCKQYVVKGE